MSVIAKMNISSVTPYGVGRAVNLSCVASNETMAGFAEGASEEDRLFTRASPSGSMLLNQPATHLLGKPRHEPGDGPDTFYVVVLFGDEADGMECKGASAIVEAKVTSLTDFGGTSREVQFHDHYNKTDRTKGVDRLNWKMMVDNPGAHRQFKPGQPCLIAFFPTTAFDRDHAIAAAHRAPQAIEPLLESELVDGVE